MHSVPVPLFTVTTRSANFSPSPKILRDFCSLNSKSSLQALQVWHKEPDLNPFQLLTKDRRMTSQDLNRK